MAMKKAVFFTIDSLLASGIIIVAIMLVSNFYSAEQQRVNVNYASQDIVRVFSAMTVGEMNNDYIKSLISSGLITNINSTLIEQIGEFWANGDAELATNFTRNLTEEVVPGNYGFKILVNDEEIYTRGIALKKSLVSSRKLVSGIAKAKPTQGFTGRVLLNGIKSKRTNAYVYFGGYEGDGNLTKKLILPNDVISFNSSYLEVEAGGNFNLYINGVFSGSYAKSSSGGGNMLADKWNLSNAYLANFRTGENDITVNFTSGSSYIAGGFLRVSYTTSSYNDTNIIGYEKYSLPGIDGVINLYSSIYAPSAPGNMNISLHFLSEYQVYLTMGNTTLFESYPSSNEQTVALNNSNLSGALNYASMAKKTIPVRIGLKSANFTIEGKVSDSVLITDRTGSMSACDITINCTSGLCDSGPSGGCHDRRDNVAIKADKKFIDEVLKTSGSKVGLVGFGTDTAPVCDFHDISDDNVSLKYRISNYSNEWCGWTCISCGIQAATELLTENEALSGMIQKSAVNTTQLHVGDSGSGASVSIPLKLTVNKTGFVKSRLSLLGKDVDAENGYYDCVYLNGNYLGRMCEPHDDPGWHTCSYPVKPEWLNAPSVSEVTSGLIAYWKLDDGSGTAASDSSGSGYNGALKNGPTWTAGAIGGALDFDGINDHVNVTGLLGKPTDISVSGWVQLDARDTNGADWINIGDAVVCRLDETGIGHGTSYCGYEQAGPGIFAVTNINSNFAGTGWHHFVWTFNDAADSQVLYLDGAVVATSSHASSIDWTKTFPTAADDTNIGRHTGYNNFDFNGRIDEVRVYNRPLSASEVSQLYIMGSTSLGLVGYWKFNEGSGIIAGDSSGVGNNGNLVNGPVWANGMSGTALDFDGNNDYVSVPYSTSLNVKKLTVAAWVYKEANAPNWANVIARQYGTSANDVFNLVYANTANDEYTFIIRTAGGQVLLTGPSSTADLNTWVHFAATYNGSNMTIYKNGVQTASTNSQSGDIVSETKRITIGSQDNDAAGNPSELFPGIIDDVRFYNRSLSPSEIMEISTSTSQNQVTITGGTTSGCFQTSGDNDDWDFKDVKLTVWESNSAPSINYHNISTQVDIGDSPLQSVSSSLLTINVEKSKLRSALIEFDAINVDPSYYDCVFVNGNYAGSVDYQKWNGTNVWQKVILDVPVAWLKNGANEINLTSGTTSGCLRTSGDNDEWRFRNLNLSVIWTNDANSYNKIKSMLVMSDGEANTKIGDCGGCDSTGARNETVKKSCEAKSLHGISVYTVLFGDVTNSNAIKTLNQSACCDDCSHFYTASNSEELISIYSQIAQSVGNITFQAQSVNLSGGNLMRSILYPDSYISFNYTPLESQFNKVPLGFETERFGNNISSGTLTVYPNTSVSEAKVTSYSGTKWTDNLAVNGNNVYRLADFGNNYLTLGDPFAVNIPVGSINTGSNSIVISAGENSTASSGGSNDSRVIYTLLLNGFADYSAVVAKSDGCSWTVNFEDGSASTIKVPSSYSGADICSFAGKTYDSNDALDNGVFQLFSNLDIDKDGKLEVNIDESNLNINILTLSKVPSLWGPAIIEIQVWE